MSNKSIQKIITKTISDKRHMNCQFCINNPMQMVERRLNKILAKNPNLVKLWNSRLYNPVTRKHSH